MAAPSLKTVIRLRAAGGWPSHSRSDIAIRDLTSPVECGGKKSGPSPVDTALVALIGCSNVFGSKCADMLGIDVGRLMLMMPAVSDVDRRGATLSEEIEPEVVADGAASNDDLVKLAVRTRKFCSLSNLFHNADAAIVKHWHRK